MKIVWGRVIGTTVFWVIVFVGVVGLLFLWEMEKALHLGKPEDVGLADHQHILRHLHELRDADPAPCYYIGVEQ